VSDTVTELQRSPSDGVADVAPPRLDFRVESLAAAEYAAVPTLVFRVHVDAGGREIRSLSLNTQLRIDAARRRYSDGERERLYELYGAPAEWSRSLRSLLWTHVTTNLPAFSGETTVELHVTCTYDFEVVASKYLNALGEGDVPLELLFSGTIFYPGDEGLLQVAQVPWDREARCAMPVRVWRQAIDTAFPNAAWLRLSRDTFERLQAIKSSRALLTWDAVLEELLDGR
jgi:hypothetical protein